MLKIYTVAFLGHRYIERVLPLEEMLEEQLQRLILEKEYIDFLVGRHGDFDRIASSSVRRVQKKIRDDNSSLVLLLPYETADFRNNQKYYEEYYNQIEFSHRAMGAYPKAAIGLRNFEMVDRADLVICYVTREEGGAWRAVKYAMEQKKTIINLADK